MGEGSTRNLAQSEKQTMTVLDILQKTPEDKKEIRFKRSRSNSPYSPKSASFRELTELSRENSRVLSQRNRSKTIEKSPDKVQSTKEKTEALSEMTRETRRLLMFDRADIYKDYDKQVEMLGLRPFNKGKFEKKSFNPANVLRKVPLPKNDRKKAFIDFLNKRGNEKEIEKTEPKTKIKGNTFHGRKWKSHMTKARISNFGPKENYAVLISATHAGLEKMSRKRSVGAINRELDAVGENLKMDVASSQEGYLKNIMDFTELEKKAYGDKLTKYLDVLNFEKANYNALNGDKIEEALELVDVIYEAREKSAAKKNKSVTKPKEPIYEEEEDSYEERLRRQELDLVYDRPVKMVPPSRLYLKRNSLTSINFHPEERKSIASQDSSQKKFKRGVTKPRPSGAFGNFRTERTMSSDSMMSGHFPSDMRHTNISWTSTSIKNS